MRSLSRTAFALASAFILAATWLIPIAPGNGALSLAFADAPDCISLPAAVPARVASSVPVSCNAAQGQLTVTPLGPVTVPIPPLCASLIPPEDNEFSVSGAGLLGSTSYRLALTGNAGGIVLDQPLGTVTTDASGSFGPTIINLPAVPGHNAWTVIARPSNLPRPSASAQAPLHTFTTDCIQNGVENGGHQFTVSWAGAGFKPGTTATLQLRNSLTGIVYTDATYVTTVDANGSFNATTQVSCTPVGAQFQEAIIGSTIDNPTPHAIGSFPTPTLPCT